MFNYGNLSDVEFEELCRDIMQIKLGVKLHTFTKGRDGGIDICDMADHPQIVIQAKHYFSSSFSTLKSSLEREKPKLERFNHIQYYVCTSKGLSPDNVSAIYEMFHDYMPSIENILGQNELDEFLNSDKARDILLKHYKLGLSSYIISDLLNHDASIDTRVLFDDIEQEKKYFVATKVFFKAINQLKKDRILILTGNPGSGKTITSQMLVYEMVKAGFRIIYISDHNIKEAKRLLSHDKEKELIFLDDCFGQRYFEMKTETGDEITKLIKYVKYNKNKLLLMNSRITIYSEAKAIFLSLQESVENNELDELCINMDDLSMVEKAQILYNHLYFNNVPREYLDAIKAGYQYRKIVCHKNYMPRIIRRFTNKHVIESYTPEKYIDYVFSVLNNPKLIWEDEYTVRLQTSDRVFVNTLYSLTDTCVNSEIHRRAFDRRMCVIGGDTTADNWNKSKRRLIGSMIKIIDKDGEEVLAAADPSVNDYLDIYMKRNIEEANQIVRAATEYIQIQRMKMDYFGKMVEEGTALNINYSSEKEKIVAIISVIGKNNILREEYREIVSAFLLDPSIIMEYDNHKYTIGLYFSFMQGELYDFYNTLALVTKDSITNLLMGLDLNDYPAFFSKLKDKKEWICKDFQVEITECIRQALIDYIFDASINEYYDGNIYEAIGTITNCKDGIPQIDYELVSDDIILNAKENLEKEIGNIFRGIPQPFDNILTEKDNLISIYFDTAGTESIINAAMGPDEDLYEEYRERNIAPDSPFDEIDRIFHL